MPAEPTTARPNFSIDVTFVQNDWLGELGRLPRAVLSPRTTLETCHVEVPCCMKTRDDAFYGRVGLNHVWSAHFSLPVHPSLFDCRYLPVAIFVPRRKVAFRVRVQVTFVRVPVPAAITIDGDIGEGVEIELLKASLSF